MNMSPRDMHLLKKALVTAIYVMDRTKGPFDSPGDLHDMKLLMECLTDNEEAEHYMRSAALSVTGRPSAGG